jgi:16S rRNA (adenine1518-N6/adenine1519-N6)-dimethyltransferase
MAPLGQARVRAVDESLFAAVVMRAFSQRRKMLRGVLGAWTALIPWQALQIEPTWRAEQVSVLKFIELADALHAAGVRT